MKKTASAFDPAYVIISIVESASYYRPSRREQPFEWLTSLLIRFVLGVMFSALAVEVLCVCMIFAMPGPQQTLVGMAAKAFGVVKWSGILGCAVVFSVPLIRLRHRHADRVARVAGAFHHQRAQVKALAEHNVEDLKSVERFFAARPIGVQGYFGSLFGTGAVSLASIGALAGLVKVMFEDVGGVESATDACLPVALTAVLVLGLLAAIAMRGAATRVSRQRTLLGEAILLVESADSCVESSDTQH